MNAKEQEVLSWIDGRAEAMRRRVERWAAINTGTRNVAGVNRLVEQLAGEVATLDGEVRVLDVPAYEAVDESGRAVATPLGRALSITKRPGAPRRALLVIHTDTVYGPESPFQEVSRRDGNTLHGPGVADAKGGIAVLLTALEAFEQSEHAGGMGWRVILNPDEEIGSPGSLGLLREAAAEADVGLVYEPALPDGSLIGARKGSGNFTLVVRGRAAHAGREFELGRNAVAALSRACVALDGLNGRLAGVTVNVGQVRGGGPVNMVPDLAIARFNVRCETAEQQAAADEAVRQIVAGLAGDGIEVELHGQFRNPAKPETPALRTMLEQVAACGRELGLALAWQASGGVCDGNKLAAAGLPTVDTLGPRGGAIHSLDEYLLLDSLTERAKLTALLLMRYASGRLTPPAREPI